MPGGALWAHLPAAGEFLGWSCHGPREQGALRSLSESNNRNTIGAFRAISAAGASTALAGFDDFELADALGLPLTIVAYDSDELGREAGRLLLDRIRDTSKTTRAPRRIVVPTSLVEYGPQRPAGRT